MKRSELIQELLNLKTVDQDPEITFWVSETESLSLLSVYPNHNYKEICFDLQLN